MYLRNLTAKLAQLESKQEHVAQLLSGSVVYFIYCLVYIVWARRCIYCAMTSPSHTCRHCQLREMCRGAGVCVCKQGGWGARESGKEGV